MKVFRVPREENHEADLVAKLVTSRIMEMPRGMLVETAETLCTEKMLIYTIEEKEDWWTLIKKYLRDAALPSDLEEAKKVVRWFRRYAIYSSDELYRRSFS